MSTVSHGLGIVSRDGEWLPAFLSETIVRKSRLPFLQARAQVDDVAIVLHP
jgi:hypothetical protein